MQKAARICIPAAFALQQFVDVTSVELALAKLLTATRTMQADLLALDFPCIAGDKTGFAQLGLERSIVVNQGAGDAVTYSTGLTRLTTTSHVDHDVKRFSMVSQHQGLLADHDRSLTTEEFFDVFAVHYDLAGAFFQKYASDAGFATAGTIVPFTNHFKAP